MVTQEIEKEMILELVEKQKKFFKTGATLKIKFRLKQLKILYQTITNYEDAICDALHLDFGKSKFEAYGTEIALIQEEIKYFIKKLPALVKPKKVKSSIASLPSKSFIYHEPYGHSLIIGPWNYPVMLMLQPLVGSLAAGNCVILKPSELAPHTSKVVKKIVQEVFEQWHVAVIEGGPETTQELLKISFDHIFFTGSEKVGKIVYEAAARNLTPCILELGGKSPCIVDEDANVDLAARRVVWGKLINGGQSCVAPDYLLAHKTIRSQLLIAIISYINKFYGKEPEKSPDLPRIINNRNFERLTKLLDNGKVMVGGKFDAKQRYISPTVLEEITWDDPIMQEEIFGPILPVIEFENLDDVLNKIKERPKPLALYYFSNRKKKQEKIINEVSFGGGCINDTMFQFGSPNLPVGGVGSSGIGKYHGRESFLAFSNSKGIVKKNNKIDIPFRYAPYEGKLNLLKSIFKI